MKRGIISALVIIMFMSAIETSIISLATPAIGKDLHIGESIALIFTSYMLSIVIITPLTGEFIKRLGEKYTTILGIIVFVIGSILCGLSTTFEFLVTARFIQGLGAGIMMTMGNIIPKVAFEIPYRYKVMGIVGSVWGISSIVGPLAGGMILEYLDWSFLFYINVPIALIAIVLVLKYFKFEAADTNVATDYKGMSIFYAGLAILMTLLLAHLNIVMNVILFILLVGLLYYFIKFEKQKPDAFIPVNAFTNKVSIVMATDFLFATMMMGINIFMPMYLQVEKGWSPIISGLLMFPMSIFWLWSAFILDRIEHKIGLKRVYQFAFILMAVSSLLIGLILNTWIVPVGAAIMGLGFGIIFTKNVVTIQESTSGHNLGAMMSTYSLLKFIGSTFGSIVMGILYFNGMFHPILNVMLAIAITSLLLIVVYEVLFKQKVTRREG